MNSPANSTDAAYPRRFSVLVSALGIAVVAIVLLVLKFNFRHVESLYVPGEGAAARIAPVGAVQVAGAEAAAPHAETAPAATTEAPAAAEAAPATAATDAPVDGKAVYDGLCQTCHSIGLAGAPKVSDHADWDARLAQGEETLVKHAIEGYTGKTGVMPARGGNPTLTDAQVRAAVEWMMAKTH